MNFYRVEFVKVDGTETFEIVQCPSAAAAETAIKLKYFRCVVLKVTRV